MIHAARVRNALVPTLGSILFVSAVATAAGLAGGLAHASPVGADTPDQVLGVTKESTGAVTVTLTPSRYAEGRLLVDMTVSTHTVDDLDKYDLKKIVSLEVGGKSVAPTSAPRLRGHHSRGQLVFPLEAAPRAFAITIRGLDEPGVRILSWP